MMDWDKFGDLATSLSRWEQAARAGRKKFGRERRTRQLMCRMVAEALADGDTEYPSEFKGYVERQPTNFAPLSTKVNRPWWYHTRLTRTTSEGSLGGGPKISVDQPGTHVIGDDEHLASQIAAAVTGSDPKPAEYQEDEFVDGDDLLAAIRDMS